MGLAAGETFGLVIGEEEPDPSRIPTGLSISDSETVADFQGTYSRVSLALCNNISVVMCSARLSELWSMSGLDISAASSITFWLRV